MSDDRAQMIAIFTTVTGDPELAAHMYDKQLLPQRLIHELRAEGQDISATLVNTNPEAPGFEVSCICCGRTAKLPFEPPKDRVVMCPTCQAEGRTP